MFDAYENSWSHQRRRRRRHHQSDGDQPPPSKRLKSSTTTTDDQSSTKECTIQVRLDEQEGVCTLYLLFVDGTNTDSANQISQYIKNQFPNYCQSLEPTLTKE